jgi:superfamily II DNA or RNA helicase
MTKIPSQNEIKKKYKKYIIPESINSKPLKELCKPPTSFKHQYPQLFLSEFLSPSTPYKGMLIYHQIGSGKTCTAISIAEKWKRKRNIIILLPASLMGNFRDELRTACAGESYMTNKERKELPLMTPNERKQLIKKTDERIDKYYTIMSYHKFVEKRVSLKNSILIIDEIQNMISESGSFYKKLKKDIERAPDDLRVILLSATPIFDKPLEIALTLNLLPLNNKFVLKDFNDTFIKTTFDSKEMPHYSLINKPLFKEHIKGFISYYKGMPTKSFPSYTIKLVKCKMEPFQYKSYQIVLKKEAKKKVDILKLPNDFFIGSRIISNIAFPNSKANINGFESWTGRVLEKENLKKYSIKFYKILLNIKKSEGKIFIYSNFLGYGGITSLVEVLEYHGYYDFKYYNKMEEKAKKNKQFYAIWSGSETQIYKEEIKYTFNTKNSPLHILIGSPAIKEGVSLKRVRQVHILEPYWNYARIAQIMGRAIRYCSHADLPRSEQHVDIFMYIAVRPNESSYSQKEDILERMSVDRYIQYLADVKKGLIDQFEQCLKETAVDCELNKALNKVKCSE